MISVAMTVYNGKTYVKEQLDSIIHQTMAVDEIVICVDGSKDGSLEVLYAYEKEHPNISFQIVENEKQLGYRLNFHKAVSLCKGDFVFLCDQDDYWEPNKVETMISTMKQNSDIHVLSSSFRLMDGKSQLTSPNNQTLYIGKIQENELKCIPFKEYIYHNYFQGCSLLINEKSKLDFIQNYTGTIPHDWYLNMVASKYNHMYFYNVPLFRYRIHDKNTIGIPNIGLTMGEKIQKKNNFEIRSQFAKEGIAVIDVLEKTDPDFVASMPALKEMKAFFEKHIIDLQEKRTFSILASNFNPHYRFLKTKKARIMDIFYSIL